MLFFQSRNARGLGAVGTWLSVILGTGCAGSAPPAAPVSDASTSASKGAATAPPPQEKLGGASKPKLGELTGMLDSLGYESAFVARPPQGEDILLHPERCRTGYLPASTFKIPNSLIALETGVVSGPDHLFKWDGVERPIAAWNQDHTLRTAFQASAIWYYQRVAREVGQERMQSWVDKLGYGNRDINPAIDHFWLDGSLRITPVEEVDFVQRLYEEKLPVSVKNQRIVKDIMRSVDYPALPLYVKTGRTGLIEGRDYGWYVGYLVTDAGPYFFATLLTSTAPDADFGEQRKRITLRLLAKIGADVGPKQPAQ